MDNMLLLISYNEARSYYYEGRLSENGWRLFGILFDWLNPCREKSWPLFKKSPERYEARKRKLLKFAAMWMQAAKERSDKRALDLRRAVLRRDIEGLKNSFVIRHAKYGSV